MWAITNRHKEIAKLLLDHGASPDVKSSSGRTAFDFAAPHSEISDYLHQNGYKLRDAGIGEDFYSSGFSQDRFEQEMEESEMKRRMMMESSRNLEVDLSSLGMDERPEVSQLSFILRILILCVLIFRRRQKTMNSQSLYGTNVYMIKCLFFRNASSTSYWTSS